MKNPPPDNPRVNDTWIDSAGELRIWDGANWMPYEDLPDQPTVIYKSES